MTNSNEESRKAFEFDCPVFDFKPHPHADICAYLDAETERAYKSFEAGRRRILALLDSPEMVEAVSEATWNFDNEHDHGMGEWGDTNKRRFPQYCAEEASRSKAVLTKIKDMINE